MIYESGKPGCRLNRAGSFAFSRTADIARAAISTFSLAEILK